MGAANQRMPSRSDTPMSTGLSQALVAYVIELDNEFEERFARAGGGARVVSVSMWSNLLRFVGDGITVGELRAAVGAPKSRVLSTLGGMERWRYITLDTGRRSGASTGAKRDGYGSARGLESSWIVRPTPAGRTAEAIWAALFDDIDARWSERFGGRRDRGAHELTARDRRRPSRRSPDSRRRERDARRPTRCESRSRG